MTKYVMPGAEYARSVSQFTAETLDVLQRSGSSDPATKVRARMPIKRLFEIFPLNALDNSVAEDLISRGDIVASDATDTAAGELTGQISNRGDWIQLGFGDDRVGILTITFPDVVAGSFIVAKDQTSVAIRFNPPVLVAFEDPPKEIPILRGQFVSEIVFRETAVVYHLYAEIDNSITTELVLDLTLSVEKALALIATSRRDRQARPEGPLEGTEVDPISGAIVVCLVLTCVWCATSGGNGGVSDPRIVEPGDKIFDYTFLPDCLTEPKSNFLQAYFVRSPIWGDPMKLKGKTALLRMGPQHCVPPYDGERVKPGVYPMKITNVFVDITLPMAFIITGPRI